MRSRLRGRRGSVWVAIDKSYAVRISYAISLHCTNERPEMTAMAAVQASMMKAIVRETYGSPDVLKLGEVEKPELTDDRVLVRVHAASVARGDWYTLKGLYVGRAEMGLRRPKSRLVGGDFAGTIEAVGRDVTGFQPGDEVFGARTGALAEYVCARALAVALKPAHLTFEEAAAVPTSALTALQ